MENRQVSHAEDTEIIYGAISLSRRQRVNHHLLNVGYTSRFASTEYSTKLEGDGEE